MNHKKKGKRKKKMSKMIKLTPEVINECKQECADALNLIKCSDGKITYTKSLGVLDVKARVHFTESAWQKQRALIEEFNNEVAWHGVAIRDDEDKHLYHITDILVYPQEVTGATVTTDQEKYQTWLYEHDDDVFNNIRMQGHSHVNMGVSPSSVDTNLYDQILDQLDDTMFYIFMIWNKRGEKTIKIYDLRENIFFDTGDITVTIGDEATNLDEFIKEAKELVQTKTYSQPMSTGSYYNYNHGAWKGGNYSGNNKNGYGASRYDGVEETMHYIGGGKYSYGYDDIYGD